MIQLSANHINRCWIPVQRLIHHGSPDRGKDGCANSSSEGQLGRGGSAECDWVAFISGATFDLGLVGDAQQGGVGGGIASSGRHAALAVETIEARDTGECWTQEMQRDDEPM